MDDSDRRPAAGALVSNGDDPGYPGYISLVHQVRGLRPSLPVMVVTRLPELAKWLDALEAGAAARKGSAPCARNQVAAGASNSLVLL